MSSFDFDAIVIGSGFGGAVSACRLAEAGMKVVVLERGRRWTPETYPREPTDAWLWDEDEPHLLNGWADLRTFSDVWVVTGAGVGGGSLIYANVSVEAKPEAFRRGWPPEITYDALKPYYERAGRMLCVQELPDSQLTERFKLVKEGAEKLGWGDRFRKLPLAVSFDPAWQPGEPPRTFINAQGRQQSYCIQCGNCDIGCQVSAKNTLDLNYLAAAEKNGAEIRPLHLVLNLEPLNTGWRVHADKLQHGRRERVTLTAQRVLLGAGSIGTTELLLRCRDEQRTLPRLSPRLGYGWAFNGDFVTPTFYKDRTISPSHGVTISCAIDLLDGVEEKQQLFIEDGGIPNLASDFIQRRLKNSPRGKLRHLWKERGELADVADPVGNMMPWFGQAVDAGDGRLRLGRLWYAPWRRALRLDWRYQRSEAVVDAMVNVHKKLSAATGGEPWVPPTWTYLHNLITPHPLGGCNMGITASDGVCDADGKVFGYENLHVMDGAAIPRAIGLNPSRTIAALAERNVEKAIR
ncbi:MAG: GMC oxidoreductase [Pseudomonadota bacterium]|nr:GMC oxidoreductase [Pseudomonadota bacterium]